MNTLGNVTYTGRQCLSDKIFSGKKRHYCNLLDDDDASVTTTAASLLRIFLYYRKQKSTFWVTLAEKAHFFSFLSFFSPAVSN